jgi:hypothetical protein
MLLALSGTVSHWSGTSANIRTSLTEDMKRLKNRMLDKISYHTHTKMYPKVSGLAAWSENCKRYSYLPLGAVVSLFCESV